MAIEDDLRAAIVTLTDIATAAVDAADLHALMIGTVDSYPPVVEAVNSMRTEIANIRTAIAAARVVAGV